MNTTEIKINNLLGVISPQTERSTLHSQLRTIIEEVNVLLTKTFNAVDPTDEITLKFKKINVINSDLSLLNGNQQMERNQKNAQLKLLLLALIDEIQDLSFAVTFNSNGGSAVSAQSIAYGESAIAPTDPTKSNYVFREWFTDNTTFEDEYDFDTEIYNALTLYAKWIAAITLTFNVDGGSSVAAQVIGTGETATEPTAPTKSGNVFRGWFNEVGLTTEFDFDTVLAANKTIYAKWLAAVTATFNVDGGSAVTEQVIGTGEKVVRPDDEDQVKAGFQFINWYTSGAFSTAFDFDVAITENKTIYAKYLEEFAVSYQSNGGSAVAGEIVLDGALATEPADPTKTGKTFDGWYTDDTTFSDLFDFATDTITADIALYAKWV